MKLDLIRKKIPHTIAESIVGVQPMSSKVAKSFVSKRPPKHVCSDKCDQYNLIHDFFRGYGYSPHCPKASVQFVAISEAKHLKTQHETFPYVVQSGELSKSIMVT